jgi:hypothetical protein
VRRAAANRAAPGQAEAEHRFHAPAAPSIAAGTPDHLRLAIRLTCRRPELRPLCAGTGFAVDADIDLPARVVPGGRIVLHPAALAEPTCAALVIRHALELALWQGLGTADGAAAQRRTGALLACRVAARYAALLPVRARETGLQALPDWLRAAYRIAAEAAPEWHRLPAELERLDGGAIEARPDPLPDELLELAAPSEHLLVSGGGSRLRLDPATGLNVYGWGAVPSPEVLAFASSTASTISAPAYRAVEALRQALLRAGQAGRLEPALAAEIADIKREVLARCGAGDLMGTEVVLTPSGTDGELAALHLARRGDRRLVNLVIAPEETGSGVPDAAGGRHFAPETPHGAAVAKGEAIAELAPGRVAVETVEIRGPDGAARPLAAIDTEVAARVRRAVANGARCLVHLLDASKSGLAAPSPGVVRTLCARHGARIEVVVDACQLRLRPERIRSYLEQGWMVLVTGSKFAMGPPFAGALLVPARLAAEIAQVPPLPAGFAQYFARAEWPAAWQPIGAVLPPRWRRSMPCRKRCARGSWASSARRSGRRSRRPRSSTRSSRRSATAPRPSSRSVSCARMRTAPADPWAPRPRARSGGGCARTSPTGSRSTPRAPSGGSRRFPARSGNRSRSVPPARSGFASGRV